MKKILFKTDDRDLAGLVARITLAVVLFPHGAQKLLGWFGGYGFPGTMEYFTETRNFPYLVGLLVIILEFIGPLALLAGYATRFWAFAIVVLMTGIVLTTHMQNGFFMNWFGNQAGEGIEYGLLAIGLGLVLVKTGGGTLSADSLIKNY
ncbi:MAG TPA: DoxX family protein [Chitinophagaceae bacterium]|nr:DoxX family protein [Chitinophagaceae bacterium]